MKFGMSSPVPEWLVRGNVCERLAGLAGDRGFFFEGVAQFLSPGTLPLFNGSYQLLTMHHIGQIES